VFSKIVSKVLVDKRVLGGHGEEVLFLVFIILGLMGGDVSKDIKTNNWGRRDGGAGDDIGRAVRDVEEGVVLWVVKDRPGKFGGWGSWDKRSRCRGSVSVKVGTWEIPSIVVRLEDFKDGGSSISGVLLVYVIKGRPRCNRDVGEGGGGNDGGLGGSEGHLRQ